MRNLPELKINARIPWGLQYALTKLQETICVQFWDTLCAVRTVAVLVWLPDATIADAAVDVRAGAVRRTDTAHEHCTAIVGAAIPAVGGMTHILGPTSTMAPSWGHGSVAQHTLHT